MKGLFLTIVFVAIASVLNAQSLSAGLRVGPTAFLELSGRGPVMPFEYQQGAIAPELFARYRGKSRWAFEVSLSAPTSLYYEERVSAIGASWEHGMQETKTHYYELGLAAQYEVSCRRTKGAAKQPRFHYYVGLSVAAVLMNDRSEIYEFGNPETSVMSIVSNDFGLWGGVNHTLAYDLSGHWSLMAIGDFRVNLNSLTGIGYSHGGNNADASMGFRLGAGYRIWKKQ